MMMKWYVKCQNSLDQWDSTHYHSYNSNMDDFSYLGYNCSNTKNYLASIG